MNPKWRKVDQFDQLLPASSPDNLTDKYPELLSLSCFQLWKELFTDEMLEHISDHTNLYANRDKNDFSFQTNVDAIGRFLGIISIPVINHIQEKEIIGRTVKDLVAN